MSSDAVTHGNAGAPDNLARRRIIILLTTLDMGGAERQALILARHLHTEVGAQVEIWGLGAPSVVSQQCDVWGIPWRSLPWAGNPRGRMVAFLRLGRWLGQARPEILLPYTLVPNVLAGWLWRWCGARSCIWNQRDAGIGLTLSLPKRLAVRWTPRFVANTRHGAAVLAQRYGLDAQSIAVVPNAIEPAASQRSPTAWRDALHVTARTPLVAMVANLTPYKDHATLLQAWRTVRAQFRAEECQPVLVLAGRFGPTHAELVALAEQLQIGHAVRFLGAVDDITGLLSCVQVGVLSSQMEGMPNAILEYMAAGLPVVATDIPPIREIFEDSRGQAALTPLRDADALAAAILSLLRDESAAVAQGAQNHTAVLESYSPHNMIQQMTRIIGQELAGDRKGCV